MDKNYHAFHMVSYSPWPLMLGFGAMGVMVEFLSALEVVNTFFFVPGVFVGFVVVLWWRDVVRESTFQGEHGEVVLKGLMGGMLLFIVSEVLFFVSFFWAFFHSSLSPSLEIGVVWPSFGLESFNPFQIPLLNTAILLSSGVSVTWAHHALLLNLSSAWHALLITYVFGVYFLLLQLFEYWILMINMSDSVYGAVFFMSTGFHGFHVIVGTIFLCVMWVRVGVGHFSSHHHFGFEAAAWYWHFVDVVWLFLFSVVYWWGV